MTLECGRGGGGGGSGGGGVGGGTAECTDGGELSLELSELFLLFDLFFLLV